MDITDVDSDFMFVTNHSIVAECAKICYEKFPTIVNALKESGLSYVNTPEEYARLDNILAKSRRAIGESSNIAQAALSYYWTKPDREYMDVFIIMSVLAQVAIDNSKRMYEVDAVTEIDRIKKLPYMKREKPFPEFMRYTRPVVSTDSEGIERERRQLREKVDPTLTCPMNHLNEWLDKIQGASKTDTVPISNFLVKPPGKPRYDKITKAMRLAGDFQRFVADSINHFKLDDEESYMERYLDEYETFIAAFDDIKIRDVVTISRMIESSLTLCSERECANRARKVMSDHARRILNCLYKTEPQKFLSCFSCSLT